MKIVTNREILRQLRYNCDIRRTCKNCILEDFCDEISVTYKLTHFINEAGYCNQEKIKLEQQINEINDSNFMFICKKHKIYITHERPKKVTIIECENDEMTDLVTKCTQQVTCTSCVLNNICYKGMFDAPRKKIQSILISKLRNEYENNSN